MRTKINFEVNEQLETICTIRRGNNIYTGRARCHPDDVDMSSKLTGQDIAYKRAVINAIKEEIKNMKTELKILQSFYNTVIQSKKANHKCYVLYRLQKEIKELQIEIDTLIEQKTLIIAGLSATIAAKDGLYVKLRKLRGKNK